MNTIKASDKDKPRSTLDTESDKPENCKNASENLIDKNQMITENANKLTNEIQPPAPILIKRPKDDALMNSTKPTVGGGVDQKNLTFRVKIEDRTFEIDRDTIYNKSKFFRNILLKRELPNDTPFILEGVTTAAFEPIFKWMHSGEIAIGPESIGNILEVAIKIESDDIVRTCLQYRDLMLESAGLMQVYELASKYGMMDLQEDALSKMRSDFMKLAISPIFLDFDVDQLCLLLDDSYLHIESETDVLDACIRWLTCNWEKHQVHFVRALECVRFPLLSTSILVVLATGGEDNDSQINKKIWRRVEIQNKVFGALLFKAGLQCDLPHKVSYLKPKLRKNMKRKCSIGSLDIERLDKKNQATIKIQAGLRGYNSRKLLSKRNDAAKKIQTWYKQNQETAVKNLGNLSVIVNHHEELANPTTHSK